MRSFGGGGKDPLSWNDGTEGKAGLVMSWRALSGGRRVAVETDV
jgi:hypothetical protein